MLKCLKIKNIGFYAKISAGKHERLLEEKVATEGNYFLFLSELGVYIGQNTTNH